MMRLLMVDDEQYVLRNISRMLHDSDLAISDIFTANNAQKAREIMQQESIDLLICDIEMPQESGLDLLMWTEKHFPDIVSIVLTCHANFDYIRHAMRMNVQDYLVKPIPPEELIASVQKAMDIKTAQKEKDEDAVYGKYWRENTQTLMEDFWSCVMGGQFALNEEVLSEEAKKRNIQIDFNQQHVPILFQLYNKAGNTTIQTSLDTRSAVRRMVSSGFSRIAPGKMIINLNQESFFCLVPVPEDGNWLKIRNSLIEVCEEIVGSSDTFLSCRLFCYLGKTCTLMQSVHALEQLCKFVENDVFRRDRIKIVSESEPLLGGSKMPNLNILAVLLMERSYGRAKQEVIDLLNNSQADHQFLMQFYQDFIHMFSSVLEHDSLSFSQLDGRETAFKGKLETIQQLQEYILLLIDSLAMANGCVTAVAEVTRYIDAHLDAKLTREQLAKQVYLSPDHLSRIFKQEHGKTIYEYIMDRRIELAKELLVNTDLRLTAIALNIGYSNFSQFSKFFKEKCGMSPKEYRRAGSRIRK